MKFNKRRALECKLIQEHPQKPNYYLYEVEVGELDGTTWKDTVYGADMSEALNRLLWNKRTSKIEKVLQKTPEWYLVVLWFAMTIVPASITSVMMDKPFLIIITIVFNMAITCFWIWLKKWITLR